MLTRVRCFRVDPLEPWLAVPGAVAAVIYVFPPQGALPCDWPRLGTSKVPSPRLARGAIPPPDKLSGWLILAPAAPGAKNLDYYYDNGNCPNSASPNA